MVGGIGGPLRRCHSKVQPARVATEATLAAAADGASVVSTESFIIFYNLGMKRVVHAACPHDCPDACGVLITMEDGRATKIQGDPEHPVTRGFLCAKVAKYLDRVYSPERVLYPMRRVKPKGPGSRLQLPGSNRSPNSSGWFCASRSCCR